MKKAAPLISLKFSKKEDIWSLIIVESPSKAKTISKYLKGKYKVDASAGHIRDLPVHTLGVDIKNNFEPKYVNLGGQGGHYPPTDGRDEKGG